MNGIAPIRGGDLPPQSNDPVMAELKSRFDNEISSGINFDAAAGLADLKRRTLKRKPRVSILRLTMNLGSVQAVLAAVAGVIVALGGVFAAVMSFGGDHDRDGSPPPISLSTPNPTSVSATAGTGPTINTTESAVTVDPSTLNTSSPSTVVPLAPTGAISFPSDRQSVDIVVRATGDVKNVPAGHQPWTIVEVIGDDGHPVWDLLKQAEPRLWPGPAPIRVSLDGKWESAVIVGANDPKQSGLVFRLSLVVADANVTQLFDQYNRTAQQRQYSGLPKSIVGTGMKVLYEVTVTRK